MTYSECTCTDHSTDHIAKLIRLGHQLLDDLNDAGALKALDEAVDDYVRYIDEHYPLAAPEDEYRHRYEYVIQPAA